MLHTRWRAIWLACVYLVFLVLVAGCRAVEPTPTPSPAEIAEQIVAAYPLAATAWDLDSFGPPNQSLPLLPETHTS